MGRNRVNFEQMPARFPAGTLKDIDAACKKGEKRSDFLRVAVEHELRRRKLRAAARRARSGP